MRLIGVIWEQLRSSNIRILRKMINNVCLFERHKYNYLNDMTTTPPSEDNHNINNKKHTRNQY